MYIPYKLYCLQIFKHGSGFLFLFFLLELLLPLHRINILE